jgi:glycerophosphoryl diester phosphodiesterase
MGILDRRSTQRMQIFAHRGTSGRDPENTLRAFRGAIEVGADGIEFDVHATADRVPILIHDRDVARTTDGQGNVDELPLSEVKALDAGQGERIPTLEETLDLIGDRLRLYVEVKQGGIEQEVLDVLARHPESRWLIGSFDLNILRAVRAVSPEAELWVIAVFPTDEVFAAAKVLDATTLSLYLETTTPEAASRCKEAGLDLAVWTVNDVEHARAMRDLGAVGLCTDYPAEIIAGLADR